MQRGGLRRTAGGVRLDRLAAITKAAPIMSADDYHPFIPNPPNAKIAGPTARAHAEARTKNNPRAQGLLANWERMLNGPFRGITTGGHVIPDLYAPRPEGAPTLAMIEA